MLDLFGGSVVALCADLFVFCGRAATKTPQRLEGFPHKPNTSAGFSFSFRLSGARLANFPMTEFLEKQSYLLKAGRIAF